MYRPRQEGGPVLIVFLQPQIGLNQALQNLVAVGAQRPGDGGPIMMGGDRHAEKSARVARVTGLSRRWALVASVRW